MWDHSPRVPALVCWPGVIPTGSVVGHTVTSVNWFPSAGLGGKSARRNR
jgi:uncharacterized sulfatase